MANVVYFGQCNTLLDYARVVSAAGNDMAVDRIGDGNDTKVRPRNRAAAHHYFDIGSTYLCYYNIVFCFWYNDYICQMKTKSFIQGSEPLVKHF